MKSTREKRILRTFNHGDECIARTLSGDLITFLFETSDREFIRGELVSFDPGPRYRGAPLEAGSPIWLSHKTISFIASPARERNLQLLSQGEQKS